MKEKIETLDMFSPDTTLAVTKQKTMEAARGDGCECPVCGQYVKVYKRTITSMMARQLISALNRHGLMTWFHTRDVVFAEAAGAGDFAKMEHWGLIERQAHVPGADSKRSSGNWRITPRGRSFALGEWDVPMYALIYNNTLLELSGQGVNIEHALGKKYDYREIMGWIGNRHPANAGA